MKLEQTHIDQVRTAFAKMQNKEDLLQLMNEVKPLIYGPKTVPFQLRQLTWYSNPKLAKIRYREFKVKKKSGTERSIHAPVKGLKAIQKTLTFILQCVFEPHQAAMGFVRNKSIVDNAKLHAGSRYVYNIDLKDFFPTIEQARVWKCLQLKPFNLVDNGIEPNPTYEVASFSDVLKELEPSHLGIVNFKFKSKHLHLFKTIEDIERYATIRIGEDVNLPGTTQEDNLRFLLVNSSDFEVYSGESKNGSWATLKPKGPENLPCRIPIKSRLAIANLISSICCAEVAVERKNESEEWELVKRNVLPQGAPTSPVITNIICQRLDFILTGVAKRFGLKYSRYADDITFSSMHHVYQSDNEFIKELQRVITEQGFRINETKTRLQKDGYRKEVTGLLVNEKANVQHRYIKQLRMWLYYWERYGYDRAC